ncbi:Flp pilus assembly protein TadG [Oceanisphaera litoralis]|uniref:vWA domain-containing protein n=1 Tax=Oceanisphaera litoralis TaxID=225144 RepID=UPI001957D49B|nr:vWA domain-containing protein [Oceanisphaera litoralis]MBM7454250.1 Flp pilus assembly protein TadG [Oceanisphaera litoralis]
MKGCSRKRSAGVVMVLATVAMVALLAMVGLALDVGKTYGVRAKLYAAVDAAALAAASAVAEGSDNAKKAAVKYFNANMPPEYLGSAFTLEEKDIGISFNSEGDATIDISATADVPTFFLPVIGKELIGVGVNAQTVRRAVDLAFVADNTGSLSSVGTQVTARSQDFVQKFHPSYDRLALIHYAYGAKELVSFKDKRGYDQDGMVTSIGSNFKYSGHTNSSEGMWAGLEAHRKAVNPASLRVIVFFTDGSPNTFSSEFSLGGITYRGAIRSGDGSSGSTAGLWWHNEVNSKLPSAGGFYGTNLYQQLAALPVEDNLHTGNGDKFKLVDSNHPRRPVSQLSIGATPAEYYKKINHISRNLMEDMAERAREQDIYVFTLGLGSLLKQATGPDNSEVSEDMLLRMANDPRSADYNSDQKEGIYCYAENETALGPCFEEIRKAIIRLSR